MLEGVSTVKLLGLTMFLVIPVNEHLYHEVIYYITKHVTVI